MQLSLNASTTKLGQPPYLQRIGRILALAQKDETSVYLVQRLLALEPQTSARPHIDNTSVDFQHRTHRSRDSLRILVGSSINKCLVTSNLTYDITPQNTKPLLPKSKAIPPTFTFYMFLHNAFLSKIRVMIKILHALIQYLESHVPLS
jgi:hypothetical protein